MQMKYTGVWNQYTWTKSELVYLLIYLHHHRCTNIFVKYEMTHYQQTTPTKTTVQMFWQSSSMCSAQTGRNSGKTRHWWHWLQLWKTFQLKQSMSERNQTWYHIHWYCWYQNTVRLNTTYLIAAFWYIMTYEFTISLRTWSNWPSSKQHIHYQINNEGDQLCIIKNTTVWKHGRPHRWL